VRLDHVAGFAVREGAGQRSTPKSKIRKATCTTTDEQLNAFDS